MFILISCDDKSQSKDDISQSKDKISQDNFDFSRDKAIAMLRKSLNDANDYHMKHLTISLYPQGQGEFDNSYGLGYPKRESFEVNINSDVINCLKNRSFGTIDSVYMGGGRTHYDLYNFDNQHLYKKYIVDEYMYHYNTNCIIVSFARMEYILVTGIFDVSENKKEVECTIQFKRNEIGHCLDVLGELKRNFKVNFLKYDDGWRIEEFGLDNRIR